MTDPKELDPSVSPQAALPMSQQAFSTWGVEQMAYIKPVVVDERRVYAIHAADGRRLAMAETLEVAAATVL